MIAGLAALALALALAGAAQAQDAVNYPQDNYPAAMDRNGLSAWLRETTDLPPEQVVAVSASAATAIVARTPEPDGRTEILLRAVAITRQAVARGGVLAWEMRLEVDCKSRQVRAGATTGYATRSAATEGGVTLAPADTAWRRPKADTTIEASWRAVCDSSFRAPLSAAAFRIAEVSPPKAARTPAPTVALLQTTPLEPRLAPPRVTPANGPAASAPRASRVTTKTPSPSRKAAEPKPVAVASARPAPARPAPVKTGGRAAVQVVSSPVEADARKKLVSLQHRFALQGMETRVVSAKVRGHTVYRGVLAGFSTPREARSFCRTLRQGGHDCLML